jgi:hypothetical protein
LEEPQSKNLFTKQLIENINKRKLPD